MFYKYLINSKNIFQLILLSLLLTSCYEKTEESVVISSPSLKEEVLITREKTTTTTSCISPPEMPIQSTLKASYLLPEDYEFPASIKNSFGNNNQWFNVIYNEEDGYYYGSFETYSNISNYKSNSFSEMNILPEEISPNYLSCIVKLDKEFNFLEKITDNNAFQLHYMNNKFYYSNSIGIFYKNETDENLIFENKNPDGYDKCKHLILTVSEDFLVFYDDNDELLKLDLKTNESTLLFAEGEFSNNKLHRYNLKRQYQAIGKEIYFSDDDGIYRMSDNKQILSGSEINSFIIDKYLLYTQGRSLFVASSNVMICDSVETYNISKNKIYYCAKDSNTVNDGFYCYDLNMQENELLKENFLLDEIILCNDRILVLNYDTDKYYEYKNNNFNQIFFGDESKFQVFKSDYELYGWFGPFSKSIEISYPIGWKIFHSANYSGLIGYVKNLEEKISVKIQPKGSFENEIKNNNRYLIKKGSFQTTEQEKVNYYILDYTENKNERAYYNNKNYRLYFFVGDNCFAFETSNKEDLDYVFPIIKRITESFKEL